MSQGDRKVRTVALRSRGNEQEDREGVLSLKHVRKIKKLKVRISGYKNKGEFMPVCELVILTAASIMLALIFRVASANIEVQLLYKGCLFQHFV